MARSEGASIVNLPRSAVYQETQEWISAGTVKEVERRKLKKTAVNNSRTRVGRAKVQGQYSEVNSNIMRNIKKDMRNHMVTQLHGGSSNRSRGGRESRIH